MVFDVNQLVDKAIYERSKLIDSAILELMLQGSKKEDIIVEYNAFTQIYQIRDKVKGSSKVIRSPEFIW